MNRILFPTDFSDAAHSAFKYALEIAKKVNCKLDVIHVYPEPHKTKELYMDSSKLHDIRKDFQEEMQKKMVLFTEPYDSKLIGKKIIFPSDESTNKVIEQSKRSCDLIIMGTKGERNALNKVVGSFTTKTMMNAHCPVLAIPSDTEFKTIEKITYSTALCENDDKFIALLSDFAHLFNASVEYLHIIENSEEKALHNLKLKGLSPDDSNVHLVKNNSVMDGVENFIKENKTDVLALFIPKRTFMDILFHKSKTKELTFHASLPLFVLKER